MIVKYLKAFFSDTSDNLSMRAALLSALLTLLKFVLFYFYQSYILLVSTWDSLIDGVISFINKFIIQYANTGADPNHPYGHGKLESIVALFQGILIAGGSLWIGKNAIETLIQNQKGQIIDLPTMLFIGLFVFSSLSSLMMSTMLKKGALRWRSPALESDALHYQVDFLINLGSVLAFILINLTQWEWLDPVIGVLFSFYILWMGIKLIFKNIQDLMDVAVDDNRLISNIIGEILELSPDILNIHKFRARRSGQKLLLDFHTGINENLSFKQVHELIENIEHMLIQRYNCDAIVHPDPEIKIEESVNQKMNLEGR